MSLNVAGARVRALPAPLDRCARYRREGFRQFDVVGTDLVCSNTDACTTGRHRRDNMEDR